MLKNILSLTKVFIKSNFMTNNSSKKKGKIGRILLYAFLLIYLTGICSAGSYFLVDLLKSMRQVKTFIALVVTLNFALIAFTVFISCINVLYFSKDNMSILPLPLKPFEVLGARLNTLLVYEYLECLLLFFIPMVVYGFKTGQEFLFYLFMIIVMIFLPLIPLAITSLLIMVLMIILKPLRNKTLVQMITMLFVMVGAFGGSFIGSTTSDEAEVITMIIKANGLVEYFKKLLPNIRWAIEAILDHNIISLVLFIVVSVVIYVLVIMFGHSLYYKGMLGSLFSSAGVSHKQINKSKAFKSSGLLFSYVGKEIKTYLRSPTYLVQILLPCLLMPLIMFISFSLSFSKASNGENFADILQELYVLPEASRYVYIIYLLALLFIMMYSFISPLAISKDGKDAAFMKIIPVDFSSQLFYKVIPDILVELFIYLFITALALFMLKIPMVNFIYSLFVIIPYLFIHASLILFDLRKPRLNWTSEMELVKHNFRTMISLALGALFMAIVAVLGFYFKLEIFILTIIVFAIEIIAIILLYIYISKKDIELGKNIY